MRIQSTLYPFRPSAELFWNKLKFNPDSVSFCSFTSYESRFLFMAYFIAWMAWKYSGIWHLVDPNTAIHAGD